MNTNFLGGVTAPIFFGSVSPSSAAIVDVSFTGTVQRTLIGLTVDETAEFERLDRPSPVDHLGNCLWDFEGDPKTPDEKRWLALCRKQEAGSSTWPAAEGGWVGQTLRRRYAKKVAPDRTAGKEVSCHAIAHCSIGWRRGATLFIAMLSTACIVLFASEAGAQCSARDVLQNHLMLRKTPSANMPPILVRSAVSVPVWKTITVGTLQIRLLSVTRWMQQVVASENRLKQFSLDRPLPLALRKRAWSLSRCRRPSSAFRRIQRRLRTFMRALNSWVLDLRAQRSLRNLGFNISTSRSGSFSSLQWNRSGRGRASPSF